MCPQAGHSVVTLTCATKDMLSGSTGNAVEFTLLAPQSHSGKSRLHGFFGPDRNANPCQELPLSATTVHCQFLSCLTVNLISSFQIRRPAAARDLSNPRREDSRGIPAVAQLLGRGRSSRLSGKLWFRDEKKARRRIRHCHRSARCTGELQSLTIAREPSSRDSAPH